MEKIYHKLVRDKIPEIIKNSGKRCETRVLSDEEYLQFLQEKLLEEVAEYQESGSHEELADILEVVYAAAMAQGITAQQLEAIRAAKAQKRGGFAQRIFLRHVDE